MTLGYYAHHCREELVLERVPVFICAVLVLCYLYFQSKTKEFHMKKIVLSVVGLFMSMAVLAGGPEFGAVSATSASMGGAQSGAMVVGHGMVVSGAQNMTSNQSGAFVDVSRGRDGAQVETGTYTVSASSTSGRRP
jgi:hypothetical protein